MNNKILARVVAVVLSVMMLGTVAFAAPTLNKDEFDGVIGVNNDVDLTNFGTQKTMIAFKSADENATVPASADDILAIDQDTTLEPSVSFATTKVPKTGYIIVVYGGDKGKVVRTALAVSSLPQVEDWEGAMITATPKSIFAADGVTFVRNAIEVNATFDAAAATVTEVGYKASVVGGSAEHRIAKTLDTTIEGGGSVSFNLLMVGVPAGTTMQFVPYIKY